MVAVGDKVLFVPTESHALDRDMNGNYAWEIGRKNDKGDVVVLTDNEVERFLVRIKEHADNRDRLVLIRPKHFWDAVVRGVNPDGTVSLDIEHALPGVTLHYDNIVVGEDTNTHHTCCVKEAK